jgi:hypothetical protein
MAKKIKKSSSQMVFMRAYDILLKRKDLTSAEKLVLIVVCRYWPNPYWGTNLGIAQGLGFTERYIEKVIGRLAAKGAIKRGFAHKTKNGQPHTLRVIVPKCFSEKCRLKMKWIKPEHIDGQPPEQQFIYARTTGRPIRKEKRKE